MKVWSSAVIQLNNLSYEQFLILFSKIGISRERKYENVLSLLQICRFWNSDISKDSQDAFGQDLCCQHFEN